MSNYDDIRYDYNFIQGTDLSQRVGIGSEEDPTDITGWTFNIQLRKQVGSDPVATLSTLTGEIQIEDALNGYLVWDLAKVESLLFTPNYSEGTPNPAFVDYWYDIEGIDVDGKADVYLVGKMRFYGKITRVG